MLITRVGYCPTCNKAGRPKTGEMFVVFGATSNSYKGEIAQRNGRRGYTPHIYEFNRMVGDIVYFNKICCMCGCGSYLATYQGKNYIYLKDGIEEECYTTLANWNALVLYKDETFKI